MHMKIQNIQRAISPSFLVHSKKEFILKLEYVKKQYPHSSIHIDVLDGLFAPNTCWSNPTEIKKLKLSLPFDVHLMVRHPEKRIASWKKAGAQRIFFHSEAAKKPDVLIRSIHRAHMKAGITLNPDTPIDQVRLLLPLLDAILLMGVPPGFGGQLFQKNALTKIADVHRMAPTLHIIVDGGVTFKNARMILKKGARQLVMGSALFNTPYAKKNLGRHTGV